MHSLLKLSNVKSCSGLFYLCMILCLNACVHRFPCDDPLPVVALFSQERIEKEMMVAQIGQVLKKDQLNHHERATLLYERGVLKDSLGLWLLARYDFVQSLLQNPHNAATYNYLGLYALLDGEIGDALDRFNAVLELEPSYEYSYLNRGLTFYYAGRYYLAQKDFETFYRYDIQDPYRILWLYLNEVHYNPKQARNNLIKRVLFVDKGTLGYHIIQYYLGNISLAEILEQIIHKHKETSLTYAEELTEAYFYIAKQNLNIGQLKQAIKLFKLALANQVYNFVEYRFALFELKRLQQLKVK